MATYKEIKGVTVQTRDEDPSLFVGSWASGNSSNTDHANAGGAGTQTSALAYGAESSPYVQVEEYNGSSWSEVAELNVQGSRHGFGANAEAVLATGGSGGPAAGNTGVVNVESWDGSSWTEVGDLNTKREGHGGFGTYTAGLVVSGLVRGTGYPADVESWNGSAWTEVNNVNQGRGTGSSFGLQPSGIFCGGTPAPANNLTESWDGTSWTEVADLNTNRGRWGGFFGSSNSSGLVCGGYPGPSTTVQAQTETWDGTSWTEANDLGTARYDQISSTNGSTTSGLVNSGFTPSGSTITEEWSFPSSPILTEGSLFLSGGTTLKGFGKAAGIPAATWSSGGNMNTARSNHFALGGLSDNLVTSPQGVVTTEQYNGTSWTALSSPANSGEGRAEGGSAGTATAGVIFGGWEPGASALTELWNGSGWTEVGDLNTGRNELAGFGTSTAAFGAGGSPSLGNTLVESWDGSSWTETTEINTGRGNLGGSGTTTDGLIFGGNNPNNAQTEKWDGSAWTEVGDLNTARRYGAAGGGTGPISIYAGGLVTAGVANTESWNGSSWTEVNDISTARYSTKGAPAGNNISTIVSGGNPGSGDVATTEEWTVDNALATVTVS